MTKNIDLIAAVGVVFAIIVVSASRALWGVELVSKDLELALTGFGLAALARHRYLPTKGETKD